MNTFTSTPFLPDEPQPLVRDLPKAVPYPVEALGPLKSAVEAVQGLTQAPVAIPAQSALAIASLAVQGFAQVETLSGLKPTSLYLMTIAGSGERKSACDGYLMAALRDFEREQSATYREDMNRFKNDLAIWKAEHTDALKRVARETGDKQVGSRADLHALGAEPEAPPSPDRTVTEPTFEGLTKLFATGQPSLGLFSDEGGQFLGGYAMNNENKLKTLAALNDLWQGNPIRRTRSGDGHATLHGRRLAVHLMVQPKVAHKFMSDPLAADIGFLARFLFCEPESTIGTRLHSKTIRNPSALEAFSRRLTAILSVELPMDATSRELLPRELSLSGSAFEELAKFSDHTEVRQAPGGEFSDILGTASKAAEQAARIAGVLTLWNDLNATEVTKNTMICAITLAEYYLSEAIRLARVSTISAETLAAEKLRKWLLERWDQEFILLRDIVRLGPNALRESKTARAAIATLENHGWLLPQTPGTVIDGLARKEAWRVYRKG